MKHQALQCDLSMPPYNRTPNLVMGDFGEPSLQTHRVIFHQQHPGRQANTWIDTLSTFVNSVSIPVETSHPP
jgi:hypothetical protein